MEIDELKPFEEVFDQVGCNYPKFKQNEKGVMVITTCRVLWKPTGHTHFPIQILRGYTAKHESPQFLKAVRAESEDKTYWVLKVGGPQIEEQPAKTYFFRFVDVQRADEHSSRVLRLLKTKPESNVEQQVNFLGPEALSRLALL